MENEKRAEEVMEDEEEEYVLLDLDGVFEELRIPPNAPYVLSGLDTLNPILTIDNKIKLIGEYGETIGTCYVFSENEAAPPPAREESESSEANLSPEKRLRDSQQIPAKQINPLASLTKILKFRPLMEADHKDGADKQAHETT